MPFFGSARQRDCWFRAGLKDVLAHVRGTVNDARDARAQNRFERRRRHSPREVEPREDLRGDVLVLQKWRAGGCHKVRGRAQARHQNAPEPTALPWTALRGSCAGAGAATAEPSSQRAERRAARLASVQRCRSGVGALPPEAAAASGGRSPPVPQGRGGPRAGALASAAAAAHERHAARRQNSPTLRWATARTPNAAGGD